MTNADEHLTILKDRGLLKDIMFISLSKGYTASLKDFVLYIENQVYSYEFDMSQDIVKIKCTKPSLYEKTYLNEDGEDGEEGVEGVVRASIDLIRTLVSR